MIKPHDIGWLAGIIEGEGCVVVSPKSKTLRLSVEMCDLDVLQRFKALMPTATVSKRVVKKLNPNHRDRYILHLTGAPMIGLLQTVYSLMGERRKRKIEAAIHMFKSRRNRPYKGGGRFAPAEGTL